MVSSSKAMLLLALAMVALTSGKWTVVASRTIDT
jgi:hypothetical protein